jgi:hypothetical protein
MLTYVNKSLRFLWGKKTQKVTKRVYKKGATGQQIEDTS